MRVTWVILFFLTVSAVQSQNLNALDQLLDQRDYEGIVVILQDGKIAYEMVSGYASVVTNKPLGLDTSMPLASMSKIFTAVSVMLLEERGALAYDDRVIQYMEFPYPEVTIRHLLHHTSGLKRLYQEDLNTAKEVVRFLNDQQPALSFTPGSEFLYSNTGYSVLAALVEEVSGISFGQFLDEEVFAPVGMESTFLLEAGSQRSRAQTHDKKGRIKEWQLYSYPGGTGLYSSASDLIKWDVALKSHALLSEEQLNLAFQNGVLNSGESINYGFGWRHWKGNENLVFHGGEWIGCESMFYRDLEQNTAVIILANKVNKITRWEIMELITESK